MLGIQGQGFQNKLLIDKIRPKTHSQVIVEIILLHKGYLNFSPK